MRIAKLVAGAGLLVAASIVGGTLIGGVLAAPRAAPSTSNQAADAHGSAWLGKAGEHCDVYLETFAHELGVDRDALLPAGKAAANAAIDAAVEAGDLDADRAAALKERIGGITDAGCGFLGGLGRAFGHGFGHGFVHADVLDAAADAVGLDSSDLFERMADGASLAEIAGDQGVDYDQVKADVLGALDADLDAAVDKGLDRARADAVHDRVASWLDDGGKPPMHRHRERPSAVGGPFSFR
jgi:hypothetical protein